MTTTTINTGHFADIRANEGDYSDESRIRDIRKQMQIIETLLSNLEHGQSTLGEWTFSVAPESTMADVREFARRIIQCATYND